MKRRRSAVYVSSRRPNPGTVHYSRDMKSAPCGIQSPKICTRTIVGITCGLCRAAILDVFTAYQDGVFDPPPTSATCDKCYYCGRYGCPREGEARQFCTCQIRVPPESGDVARETSEPDHVCPTTGCGGPFDSSDTAIPLQPYKILVHADKTQLEALVTEHIERGYMPNGNVSVGPGVYTQGVLRASVLVEQMKALAPEMSGSPMYTCPDADCVLGERHTGSHRRRRT